MKPLALALFGLLVTTKNGKIHSCYYIRDVTIFSHNLKEEKFRGFQRFTLHNKKVVLALQLMDIQTNPDHPD